MHRPVRTRAVRDNLPKALKRKYNGVIKSSKRLRSGPVGSNVPPSHPCLKCEKKFSSLPALRNHLSYAHPREKLPCNQCGKCFTNHSAFSNHACIRKESPKVSSGFYDLMDVAEFSAHSFAYIAKAFFERNPRTPASPYHRFQCSNCSLAFPSYSALHLHISAEESGTSTLCTKCKSDLFSPHDLMFHQMRYSSCMPNSTPKDETPQETFLLHFGLASSSLLKQKKPITRPLKEQLFENYSYFVRAQPAPEENKITPIDIPNKSDFVPSSPKEASVPPSTEVLIHPESPNVVEPTSPLTQNNLEADTQKNLPTPTDTPGGESIVSSLAELFVTTCPHCSLVCTSKSSFQQHLLTHEERIYICKICHYSFTTKANCERHIQKVHQIKDKEKIHNTVQFNVIDLTEDASTEEDTTCKYCKKNFNTKRLLGLHKRSQEGCKNKPYKCELCKLGFSSKNNYKRHYANKHSKTPSILKPLETSVSQEENSIESLNNTEEMSNHASKIENSSEPHSTKSPEPSIEKCPTPSNEPLTEVTTSDLPLPLIIQNVPLDLTIQPLDLRASKSSKELISHPTSIYSLPTFKRKEDMPTDLINVSMLKPSSISPAPSDKSIKTLEGGSLDSPKQQYTCTYCLAKFTLKSNMSRHIKKKHPGNVRPARSRNFIATIQPPQTTSKTPTVSSVSTETKIALRSALFNKNNMLNKKESIPATSEPKLNIHPISESNSGEDLASVSELVDNAYSQQFKQYLDHSTDALIIDESAASPLSLSQDKEASSSSENTEKKRNTYSSSPKRVWCTFCRRKFPWLSSLRRHLLTHTGQKPYNCPYCPVNFTTKSNCERHISKKHSHQGSETAKTIQERPFKCNLCPSSTFSNEANLKMHLHLKHSLSSERKEDDHRDFDTDAYSGDESGLDQLIPCFHCEESYATKEEMEAHINQHSELFFKCHLCEHFFKSYKHCINHLQQTHTEEYANLQKHEVLPSILPSDQGKVDEHPPVKFGTHKVACAICFYLCTSDADLKNHMTTHNQDTYPCDLCGTKLESLNSLSRHKEKHHNEGTTSLGASTSFQPTTLLISPSIFPILTQTMPTDMSSLLKPVYANSSSSKNAISKLPPSLDTVKVNNLVKNPSDITNKITPRSVH